MAQSLVLVRLSAEDIEALHKVDSYLYESESDDYFDNDQPADQLYHCMRATEHQASE
jgi:hypothetical protein